MIPVTCEGCPAVDLEHAMFHPQPLDLGPLYSVARVDKRWIVLMRRADGDGFIQFYCPPDFLDPVGKSKSAIENIAEQLNIGARGIDAIMAHETTYNPRNVGDAY